MLKFEGSRLNNVARISTAKFSGHIARHFELFFFSNFQNCEKKYFLIVTHKSPVTPRRFNISVPQLVEVHLGFQKSIKQQNSKKWKKSF